MLLMAVAGLLALLLPSALNVATTGPTALAEFAPVPGTGQGIGDLSELGGTFPGGGSSSGISAQAPHGIDARTPQQKRNQLKRCVGNPPRQTEDLLSPPCVGFFEGDNGGATARGVTRDEITVLIHWGKGFDTKESPFVDYGAPVTGNENSEDPGGRKLLGKAYAKYFNARYQTYNRYVHFYGFSGRAGDESVTRADMARIDRELRPFAVVNPILGDPTVVADESARKGIVAVTYQAFPRVTYERAAPHIFSYSPDLEDSASVAASYICKKLEGRVAAHSGNPSDLVANRVFGLLYTNRSAEPTYPALARLLKDELAGQCGVVVAEEKGEAVQDNYPNSIAALRLAGVTTVLWAPACNDTSITLAYAQAQGWQPEWFQIKQICNGPDNTNSFRTFPATQSSHIFGVSYDYRRGNFDDQSWYRAYLESCPSCAVPITIDPPLAYDTLAMMAYGIQAAGPRLTAAAINKGLHAVPPRPSISPFVPASYFSPGNYSWIKDAKEMWWDPSGLPPGSQRPGCHRLPNDGRRFRSGEWLEGDTDFDPTAGHPCQGLAQNI